MLTDTPGLRELLARLMPSLEIKETPSPSGQRVVYFCNFKGDNDLFSLSQLLPAYTRTRDAYLPECETRAYSDGTSAHTNLANQIY